MKIAKESLTRAGTDHLAELIAGKIILWRSVTVGKLNWLINRYPPARKKCLLLLFCALFAGGIITNLFTDNKQRKYTEINQASHIGQPSNVPAPSKTNKLIHFKNDRYGK